MRLEFLTQPGRWEGEGTILLPVGQQTLQFKSTWEGNGRWWVHRVYLQDAFASTSLRNGPAEITSLLKKSSWPLQGPRDGATSRSNLHKIQDLTGKNEAVSRGRCWITQICVQF
ncbi:MAG: hypothetical protein ACOYKZ_06190 [Chlamydiia bacterium]